MHLVRAALERDRRRIERRRARADHADDLAGQRLDGNAAGRMRPHAGRKRTHEVRHVGAAGAGVAVREHELARGLDAPSAVGFQMQAQHVALRLDLDEPRAVAHVRAGGLLKPRQVIGPGETRNSIQSVVRFRAVQSLVPRAEAQRGVAALRARTQRLRRAQLMHARDAPPNAGLTRLGLVDDVDSADTFALQAIRDRHPALASADDDDVVVDAGTRAHPVGRVAPGPAQRAARLRRKLNACDPRFAQRRPPRSAELQPARARPERRSRRR